MTTLAMFVVSGEHRNGAMLATAKANHQVPAFDSRDGLDYRLLRPVVVDIVTLSRSVTIERGTNRYIRERAKI